MALFRATVEIQYADFGGTGTNTWHLRTVNDGVDMVPDANNLMGLVEDFYTGCAGIFPDTASFVFSGELAGIAAQEGDTVNVTGWTTTGAVAGDSLPPQDCIVVGWRTNSGGRMGKGRTFLGPIHKNGLDTNGTPTANYLLGVRNAADALVEASDSFANGALGVWSNGRAASGGNPAVDPAFRDFTGYAVRNIFAVLRSRRD